MARFRTPRHREVSNDASDAGNGWKLNFYTTETSSRKDTFSDSALTTANANPVVADSAGRFGDIFLESGTYRVILTDADDVTIWDADPVEGASGSAGSVDDVSENTTLTLSDNTQTKAVDASSTGITITLLDVATAGDGFEVTIKKVDSSVNTVTIDGNGAETIDGSASLVLREQYESVTLRCDGDEWHIRNTGRFWSDINNMTAATTVASGDLVPIFDADANEPRKMTQDNFIPDASTTIKGKVEESTTAELTSAADGKFPDSETIWNEMGGALESAVDATNGGADDLTEIDFTGISANAKRITALFDQVSLSGTDHILIQIGDSGGIEATGYVSDSNDVSSTSGFILKVGAGAQSASGIAVLERMSGDKWVSGHVVGTGSGKSGGGVKALSATLDRVRITRTGSDTFDNGNVNIRVEYGA